MSEQACDSPAVEQLLQARRTRTPLPIPAAVAALSPAQGYELQRLHEAALLRERGGTRIGTKLGGGDMQALAALGLSGPFRGPIFSAYTHASPARLARADFFLCAVEAEVAVVLGHDIGGQAREYSRDEVAAAVTAIIPSIEIADSRWSNFKEAPAAAVIADAGFAGAWIAGEAVRDWRGFDLARLRVGLRRNGEEIESGVGMRAMGDPLLGVCAALADLGREGRGFAAGEIVSTGTCTAPYMAAAGDSLVADFGPLGSVRVDIS